MMVYCECETPIMDVEHDAGCRRCDRPVNFNPACPGCGHQLTESPCARCSAILAEQGETSKQWVPPDETLDDRRAAQAYFNAGLPWTGEFEERVMRGEVDVS